MICCADNKQFIQKILGMRSKDIKQLLKQEDQKYIVKKQNQITENMPEDLKPNHKTQIQSTTFLNNIFQVNFTHQRQAQQNKLKHFPSTFHQKSKFHHWDTKFKQTQSKILGSNSKTNLPNERSVFQKFLTGFQGQANLWKGQKLPDTPASIIQKAQKQQEGVKVQTLIKNQLLPESQIIKNMQNFKQINEEEKIRINSHSGQEADNQQDLTFTIHNKNNIEEIKINNPFVPSLFQQSKHSPFISNKTNFLDIHTNKKSTQQNYLTPQTYSMNMLQFAHNQKQQNTFDDNHSYPNVVMGGSGAGWTKTAQSIRQNPFKKTFVSASKYDQNNGEYIRVQSNIKDPRMINQKKINSNAQFRENIEDVLKYTLKDKRYTNTMGDRHNQLARSVNIMSNVMQNSFNNRIPVNGVAKRQRVLQNPFIRRPASTYKY